VKFHLSSQLLEMVELISIFDQGVYDILKLVVSTEVTSGSNLCPASGTLFFVDSIVVLDTVGTEFMQALTNIQRVFVDLSTNRAKKAFFQRVKNSHIDSLILRCIKFELFLLISIL
jgi:hypothetical protein